MIPVSVQQGPEVMSGFISAHVPIGGGPFLILREKAGSSIWINSEKKCSMVV